MKPHLLFTSLLFVFITNTHAQNQFRCIIVDADKYQPLEGSSVIPVGSKTGAIADSNGNVLMSNIKDGSVSFSISHIGYTARIVKFVFPMDTAAIIRLSAMEDEEEEEVIVSSSRTGTRIENLPTKVEVLGAEEVEEEAGLVPSNISSLLGDVAGIQIQKTSAATGNVEMRVQGLPGKYTQLLKDGMPLFGGYAGSFSVLQIPPLDLKQIEIVKGASSTLYGGGAIAGMINLISKQPKEGKFEKTFLFNQSSLKESNINIYLSNRKNKTGFTFFTGTNYQKAVDVNKDGFSDLPGINSFFIHPTFFIYPNTKNTVSFGYNAVIENRKGGDMQVLQNRTSNLHQYFVKNKSYRHTLDGSWENKINETDRFILKGTSSWFDRSLETNVFGMKALQLSYFTEASYLKKWKTNTLVAGINLSGENFHKHLPDSTQLSNYTQHTTGVFVQDDWQLTDQFIIQSGIRTDFHNTYGNFILPRISMLYKISPWVTARLGGGSGYKSPSLFSNDIDERDYPKILPFQTIKAERSQGFNFDVNFHRVINEWNITANQTFFYNHISRPITALLTTNAISFKNENSPLITKGFETYLQLLHDGIEIYAGYMYTIAKNKYDPAQPYIELIAKNKFATVLSYAFSERFKAGIETAYTGKQYVSNGTQTPGYLFAAAMAGYSFKQFTFILNCENLFDYRQSRKEQIVFPPYSNPVFPQLWAPIDGRIINLSMRIKL